jgi:hypothetical protein
LVAHLSIQHNIIIIKERNYLKNILFHPVKHNPHLPQSETPTAIFLNSSPHQTLRTTGAATRLKEIVEYDDKLYETMSTSKGPKSPFWAQNSNMSMSGLSMKKAYTTVNSMKKVRFEESVEERSEFGRV